MGKIIDSKLPIEYFTKDRNNRLEARIARFNLKKGDILRFREWDPKTDTYTGRYFDRKVRDVHKIHHATRFWTKKDLTKYGIYVFELETKNRSTPLR